MRRLVLLVLAGCAVAPADDPGAVDTAADTDVAAPRCGDLGTPCDLLPARPATVACGAALRDAIVAGEAPPWPDRLSALACFDDLAALAPAPGVVPYAVASPLWSDGADKGRWVVVPPGAALGFRADGPWELPPGTLLLKAFGFAVPDGGDRLVEVRAMVRTQVGWSFASWAWDTGLGDGVRVGERTAFVDLDAVVDGEVVPVSWWLPNDEGCRACHRSLAREVLGPETRQLNVDVGDATLVANQIVAMAAVGLVTDLPASVVGLPAFADPRGDAPVAARARSWLHGQCAHCHQPGGFTAAGLELDLRHDTPLAEMRACDVPRQTAWGPRDHVVIDPGSPDTSLLVERLEVGGVHQMPPGTSVPDREGVALVRRWIAGIDACP